MAELFPDSSDGQLPFSRLQLEVAQASAYILAEWMGVRIGDDDIRLISNLTACEARLTICGTREAAELLHVSKQRVHQLVQEGKAPKLVAELAATPVFLTRDIQDMAREKELSGRYPRRSS